MDCLIWGTPAEHLDTIGQLVTVTSDRAGGRYSYSADVHGRLTKLTLKDKLLLTTWLCDQRRVGVDAPRIDGVVLDAISHRARLNVPERLTRLLQYIGSRIVRLGDAIVLGDGNQDETQMAMALTESLEDKEIFHLCKMMEDIGWANGTFFIGGSCRVAPTPAGWERLASLDEGAHATSSEQAFVAMWFGSEMDSAYAQGIEPAISAAGYRALRIDRKEHNNKIDDEIIAEIRKSRFVIADFSCEPKNARGGVYYEAGFAHGLGLPVIWTCRKSSLDDLHFDTRQYAHIVWETPEELFASLKNRIIATLGQGPIPVNQR